MLHFVGFRGDEFSRAQRVFGPPDFIHRWWDKRAQREIADGDVVLFASGDAEQPISAYNAPDIVEP